MSRTALEMVDLIRDWELDAGESFTDYFLDAYSYSDAWLEFLTRQGFTSLVEEIKADGYVMRDGTKLDCTDQQLKFEPFSREHENAGGDWDEDVYRKDVFLWAEFILGNVDVLREFEAFLRGEE